MMTDFLLELRSEEIPARMQAKARADLARLFAAELAHAGIAAGDLVTYATPRRLVLIARDLPNETTPGSKEIKGPRTPADRKSAVEGKRVSGSVDLGGGRIVNKKNIMKKKNHK